MMEKYLKSTKYCEVSENIILHAVATIRDAITHAEYTNTPLCILTLDFKIGFDRITHSYLFTILHSHGLSPSFNNLIRNMYDGVTSAVQINGHSHGPIPIRFGVRQGCPMSMALYALCLQPPLQMLELCLSGIQTGRSTCPVSVIAYANDVTVFATTAANFSIIGEAICLYEKASDVRLNPLKSKAIAVGRWSALDTVLGIPYHSHVETLVFTFWNSAAKSINDTWARLTAQVRLRAREV
jgi:hypothetical protein